MISRFICREILSRRSIAVVIATCAALYVPGGVASGQATDGKISADASDGNQSSSAVAQGNVRVGLSRKKIDFGKVPAGTKSSPQTVTLTNNSNAKLAAPVVNVTGTGFNFGTNGCTSAIPAMGNCPVSVTFTPPSKGKFKHGLLTFTDEAAKSPQKVNLLGVGLPSPSPTATPTATPTKTATSTPTATATPVFNVAFVSSTGHDGDFMGLAGADAECASLATTAHLPSGTYKAWLSTSSVSAPTRLGSARGFVRTDGTPFADQVSDITASKILNPLILDEAGIDIGAQNVWTGTRNDGSLAGVVPGPATCVDWTSSSNMEVGEIGVSSGGAGTWSDIIGGALCNNGSQMHLYCFDVSHTSSLKVTPASGRVAFVSAASFDTTKGVAGADTLCQNEASAAGLPNPTTFLALLSTSIVTAASRFDLSMMSMPYVRPDGIKIADAPTIAMGAALDSGIWQHADGSYVTFLIRVWTGSLTPSMVSTDTCTDWTTNSTLVHGFVGQSNVTDPNWWNINTVNTGQECDNPTSVYCLEQ